MSLVERKIIETIIFFDMFDFPLTVLEIWEFLSVECTLSEVLSALDQIDELESEGGFFYLAGRSELVQVRLNRYNHSQRKFKRALKVARFFAFIPFIELIAIGNQIGAGNSRNKSDIDFFIVTKPNRIWLTRFIATSAMKLLNLRPKPNKKQDTICLSFYVTTSSLDLSCSRLDDEDIYFRYWLATLQPIFDRGDEYTRLIQANAWLQEELPNWSAKTMNWPHKLDSFNYKGYNIVMGALFGWLEGISRMFEKAIMPDELKENMNKNTNCLINDNMLKLYTTDRREEIRKNYKLQITNYKLH